MLLDHPLISQRYFFPRPDTVADPFTITCDDGTTLACLNVHRQADAGTLIHFHGNGETVSDYDGLISQAFMELGLNVLFVEYRGFGGSTGVPALGTMLNDSLAIHKHVDCPPERTVAFGRSVGSLYAIEYAERFPELAGLVIESGIADVYQRLTCRLHVDELGCSDDELQAACEQYFNHQSKMNHYSGDTLIMHTAIDGIVDVSHAQSLHTWIQHTRKKLVIFPDGNHNSIMMVNWESYWRLLEQFIDQLQVNLRGNG